MPVACMELEWEAFRAQACRLVRQQGGRDAMWVETDVVAQRRLPGTAYLVLRRAVVARPEEEQEEEEEEEDDAVAAAEADDGGRLERDGVRLVDFHIVHSTTYHVPVLFADCPAALPPFLAHPWRLGGRQGDGSEAVFTLAEHPVLERAMLAVHPCRTAAMMDHLFATRTSAARDDYLALWLSIHGLVDAAVLAER